MDAGPKMDPSLAQEDTQKDFQGAASLATRSSTTVHKVRPMGQGPVAVGQADARWGQDKPGERFKLFCYLRASGGIIESWMIGQGATDT